MASDVITAITPDVFRGYFFRDFRYLPTYDNTKTYFINNIVYLPSNDTFYKCLSASVVGVSPDSDPLQWAPYNIANTQYILDTDITKAFNQASGYFAEELFDDDQIMTDAYLYLMAHYLCMDMQMAADGINSQGSAILSSKSVGSVSVSMAIPQKYLDNPQFAYFAQTMYGQKYLAYIFPRIIGRTGIAWGGTLP